MKFFLHLLLLFLFFCGLNNDSFAQENLSNDAIKREDQTHPESSQPFDTNYPMIHDEVYHTSVRESDTFQAKFFNMLFILALLIGFMILASWALKRMMRSKFTQLNLGSHVKVLETRNLSPRATLYLIEIQDKVLLIGESPTALTYLATIAHEEESSVPPSTHH